MRSYSVQEFTTEVWGFKSIHLTEGIQNRAIHFYLGLHKFTPIAALRSEVRWYSARCKQWSNMVKHWNRLVNMSQSRLTSNLFHWDYERSVYNNNWCSELRVLLQDANMNQVCIEKVTGNLDLFTESCRVRDHSA